MVSGKELGRPSLLGTGNFFANVSLGLVHTDPRAAMVVKSVLDSLGCKAVLILRDGPMLAPRLLKEDLDLVVVDWGMPSATLIEAVRQVRMAQHSKARELPVILLGPKNDKDVAALARDAGVNEFVAKPFTARSLLSGVHAVVENPRPFVVGPSYVGPDRRDNPSFPANASGSPQKSCRRSQPPIPVSPGERPAPIPGTAQIILPDYRLKQKMGLSTPVDLATSPDTIKQIEQSLDQARSYSAIALQTEVTEIISFNRLLFQKRDRAGEIVRVIRELAVAVESRTSDLGYVRIPEVARLIQIFCDQHFRADDERSVILLEKHALTLMAMLQGGKEADTGATGEALVKDLGRQVASCKAN